MFKNFHYWKLRILKNFSPQEHLRNSCFTSCNLCTTAFHRLPEVYAANRKETVLTLARNGCCISLTLPFIDSR
ncbi:hypothetical protein ACH3XW_27840 [Acanthocheilonema viteae]